MAETMLQVRIHGVDDVRLDQVARPRCGEGDIVVAVQHCGICGSDLSYIAMGGLGPDRPMPLGHEFSARVIERGSAVDSVAVGDRVVVNPMAVEPAIGNFGPEGAFAPYLLVRDVARNPAAALPIPDVLDDRQAALVEPLAVAMHAVHRGEITAQDRAVVLGGGTIGLCIALVLQHCGVDDVVVVDRSPRRLEKAAELGATPHCVDDALPLGDFLVQQHGGVSHYGGELPASDVYFEATGVASVFEQMVALAKPQSRLVVVGVHKAPATLDLLTLLSKELSLRGAMAYPDEFPQVIDMLASGELQPERLISHDYPLARFAEALETARDVDAAIKVLVDCRA